MKLFEEFKLWETLWTEDLSVNNNELKWGSTPDGLDPDHTICDQCGKEIPNGTLPLERNLPVLLGFNSYLYNAFGKNLCWSCIKESTDAQNLVRLIDKIECLQKAIKHFNNGDLFSFNAYTNYYPDPNEVYDWWTANKSQLNYSQAEKSKIETIFSTHKQMLNSKEYQDYLDDVAAQRKAWEEEEARKATLRTQKKTVKRNSYIYMAYQDFDDGSFEIICIDKKLALVKRQFKNAIFDFIINGVDADATMFLMKINIAAIQDARLLELFKEYLSDDYPAETSEEHQELMYEYRQDFWNQDWAQCLVQCSDNEAIAECYNQGLDPQDLMNNNEWEDFVKDYIDQTYNNL